jgi:hypothetical protein
VYFHGMVITNLIVDFDHFIEGNGAGFSRLANNLNRILVRIGGLDIMSYPFAQGLLQRKGLR